MCQGRSRQAWQIDEDLWTVARDRRRWTRGAAGHRARHDVPAIGRGEGEAALEVTIGPIRRKVAPAAEPEAALEDLRAGLRRLVPEDDGRARDAPEGPNVCLEASFLTAGSGFTGGASATSIRSGPSRLR